MRPGPAWSPAADTAPWPIFVLSLPDAADRRHRISAQLAALGLAFRFHDGIDGRRGLPAEHEPQIDRAAARLRMGRRLTDGEFACALSHQAIYRRIIAEGLPGAVVLEDDATLTPAFAAFLRNRCHDAAPIIQLEHLFADVWRWPRPRPLHPDLPGVRLARLCHNACMTSAYSLSRDAAAHILRESTPLAGVADWPCDVAVLGAAVTLPMLVTSPQVQGSQLDADRAEAVIEAEQAATPRATRRPPARRFLSAAYWRRWASKRMMRRVS